MYKVNNTTTKPVGIPDLAIPRKELVQELSDPGPEGFRELVPVGTVNYEHWWLMLVVHG